MNARTAGPRSRDLRSASSVELAAAFESFGMEVRVTSRPSRTPRVAATSRIRSRERRDQGGSRRRSTSRSSARSGDSGDDGPGEPPARVCECGCGRSLEGRRPQARWYEPDTCRMRAARRDRGAALVALAARGAADRALAELRRLEPIDREAVLLDTLGLSGEEALLAVLEGEPRAEAMAA